jgi:isoaspartyl peptidase/L-asparaginase-like protein (Ntn-hydrolase superfamily)
VPVEEVLSVSRNVRAALNQTATEPNLFAAARSDGFRTLIENGLEKVLAGQTTLQELWRTVYSLEDEPEFPAGIDSYDGEDSWGDDASDRSLA